MDEIWKQVVGYPAYWVSNLGRVKSVRGEKVVILKPGGNVKRGYKMVNLYLCDKSKPMMVHRLVAMAFIPNPENKPEVNHINENKLDNRAVNLEWVTRSENQRHSNPMKGRFRSKHNSAKAVFQLNTLGEKIALYGSIRDAQDKTKVNVTNISMVCNGRRITAGGFKWKFAEL